MTSMLRCDGCGIEVRDSEASSWIIVTQSGVSHDFHAWDCLAGWVMKRKEPPGRGRGERGSTQI